MCLNEYGTVLNRYMALFERSLSCKLEKSINLLKKNVDSYTFNGSGFYQLAQ